MFLFEKKKYNLDNLYNKIVLLSRKKFFYNKLNIKDSFYSRIHLIFFHVSFLLINLKSKENENNALSQEFFDHMFAQIELNMRELGLGDVSINKQMKNFVKIFYFILLKCENFAIENQLKNEALMVRFFYQDVAKTKQKTPKLIDYFNDFRLFSINLSLHCVKKGIINFSYSG